MRRLLLSVLLLLSGCSWPVRQVTNDMVSHLADHPFDIAPSESTAEEPKPSQESPAPGTAATTPSAHSGGTPVANSEPSIDVLTATWMESPPDPARSDAPLRDDAVRTASGTASDATAGTQVAQQPRPERIAPGQPSAPGALRPEPQPAAPGMPTAPGVMRAGPAPIGPGVPGPSPPRLELQISPRIPGSEAPRIVLPTEPGAVESAIQQIYPELPPLPPEPTVLPGPDGKPYTLADLQRLAAANSPSLRQAVADVQTAKGNLIQAMTYPNPTAGYFVDPTNNNATAGVQGGFIDQPIITGGKMKLGVAAAKKDLENAELALKRARYDLATAVRNAYFTLLVDVETLAVTRVLVQFSDDIYRLQAGLLRGAQAAPYEPGALRAQTFLNRLAYKQAIASYAYDWKSLVATLGLPQLPLSQVAGQVDRFIPYYDYDDVRDHVLKHHTDVLTARNIVRKSQYLLKLAQVTPVFPDLDVRYQFAHDFTVSPFGTYNQFALGMPIPIWDQNKGNILAAQGALIRAGEESHRVEVTLTNNLAQAYGNYRNNLYAMEYYRRYILPDLVRYYRGVFNRRQIDPSSAFGDLVFAQQNLTTNVTAYLGILQSLWTSVVSVADYLQTDNLFQLATPRSLPELPEFHHMPPWLCDHAGLAPASAAPAPPQTPLAAAPSAEGRATTRLAGTEPTPPATGSTTPPPAPAGEPTATSPPANPPPPTSSPPPSLGGLLRPVHEFGNFAGFGRTPATKSYFGTATTPSAVAAPGPIATTTTYFGTEVNHDPQAY
jgi:cobalt-zinc-cadmium efflux system outer membrane protein